jgi:hypothetical protein
VLLPADITLGAVWVIRSTMPFSAIAGVDLNGDAIVSDYVPGTSRAAFNRGDNERLIGLVNTWRATRGLSPLPVSQINTNEYNSVDMRVSKSLAVAGLGRAELIAQVFNVLGRDNLQAAWQTNALSDAFGRIQQALNRQQAEVAIRFTW